MPDYDGRPDPDPTVGDVLLWVPRALLAPGYIVAEYVLRRPLGAMITAGERLAIASSDPGGAPKIGLLPTFHLDLGDGGGTLPTAGLFFGWDDAFARRHDVRARVETGGADWWRVGLTNRVRLGDDGDARLRLSLDWDRRRDHLFAGVDDHTSDDHLARFGLERFGAAFGYDYDLRRRGGLSVAADVAHVGFFRGGCCGDPTLDEALAAGAWERPVGYRAQYAYVGATAHLALDTRDARPRPESGVRAEVWGAARVGLGDADATWLRALASVAGYVDVWQHRTLGLRLFAGLAAAVEGEMPFTELAVLGGNAPMSGFTEGRLRGATALALTLDYHWPIWVFLDGVAFVEVGNAFGPSFSGLGGDDLRLSFGLGMRPIVHTDHAFELLLAAGTETFADGAEITSLRFVFGSTSAF
ncbi:MAG: BamA/TamA family outer membrane protein [Myxococcales bacterium]|nr:BamA/TamA family outer membrane protein [Myxococcales bacterium]MCB9737384.1 BamA/TamA family outer membrane protein [Deltaproteobacteria bacterium]